MWVPSIVGSKDDPLFYEMKLPTYLSDFCWGQGTVYGRCIYGGVFFKIRIKGLPPPLGDNRFNIY